MQAPAMAAVPGFLTSSLTYQTSHSRQFIDLTDEVVERIDRAGITTGIAVIASRHTTAAVVINEHEPELLKDLDRFLARLAPEESEYAHNGVPCAPTEHPNGHSHCQALLLTASVSVPIINGRPGLGQWQRIFLIELDCARPRHVTLMLLGS